MCVCVCVCVCLVAMSFLVLGLYIFFLKYFLRSDVKKTCHKGLWASGHKACSLISSPWVAGSTFKYSRIDEWILQTSMLMSFHSDDSTNHEYNMFLKTCGFTKHVQILFVIISWTTLTNNYMPKIYFVLGRINNVDMSKIVWEDVHRLCTNAAIFYIKDLNIHSSGIQGRTWSQWILKENCIKKETFIWIAFFRFWSPLTCKIVQLT
jgi:hypothetical protein